MVVIKKDGTIEQFDDGKILRAIGLSAERAMHQFTEEEKSKVLGKVHELLEGQDKIDVKVLHNVVESALDYVVPNVAKSYREYRNYKRDFVHIMDDVYKQSQAIMYIGDKENANTDSALVATQRSLTLNALSKELYKKFFLTKNERQAIKEGYIYIHDMSARRYTMNCFSRETRFITEHGVKSFYDFCDGDHVKVLNHLGDWTDATVKCYGKQPIQKVHLKRGAGYEKVVRVTPNHRWILKDGTITTNLKVGDKLIRTPDVSQYNWDDLSREDKKLWCLGFGFADGNVSPNNNMDTMVIRIIGEKTQFARRFEDAGYHVTYPNFGHGDGYVRLTDIRDKKLPWSKLNYSNVKYFIDGYLAADGHRNKNSNYKSKYRGVQVTGYMNDYMYDLLNMAGQFVTNTKDLTGQETNYGIRKKLTISYQTYSHCGDRTWVVTDIEPDYLAGKSTVWCLEVPNGHSFLLEGGIPTGNCCLFDMASVLKDGFEMGNVWYNEPKTLDTAFDVIGDVILSCAAQQYGVEAVVKLA